MLPRQRVAEVCGVCRGEVHYNFHYSIHTRDSLLKQHEDEYQHTLTVDCGVVGTFVAPEHSLRCVCATTGPKDSARMHFWIDKRSQCGYGGRHRVQRPSSLSAGVGRSRGRVGVGGGRKGMVTPVHRFQPVECVPRRPHRSTYRCYGPPPMPTVHSSARRGGGGGGGAPAADSTYVELPEPPPPRTLRALAAQRSVTPDTLLRAAALGLHRPPDMMPPHLKCGMWASFALATLFVAGAKFYFDHQLMRGVGGGGGGGGGGEAGVVCAIVGALAACGCALSLCRSEPAPLTMPERVSSTAHRPPVTPTREPSDDISLGTLLQTVSSERSPPRESEPASPPGEAPPPPYHIAVLLPGREREAQRGSPPPPAYSAIS